MKRHTIALLLSTLHVGCDAIGETSGGVAMVAHFLQGPAPATTVALRQSIPVDGTWLLSPTSVTARLTRLSFEGATSADSAGSALTDCTVTFDNETPALSTLLDCPFEVSDGTFIGMTLITDTTFEVTISDNVNGFYTDAASATGLSTTEPAGGATPVSMSVSFGTSFEQAFVSPLVLSELDAPSIAVVLDAVQTVRVEVSGGVATFSDQVPLHAFPTIDAPGRAQYYTSSGTAQSHPEIPPNASTVVRVFYEPGADGQPVYAIIPQASGGISSTCFTNAGPKAAYAADPDEHEPNPAGARPGGWLARDPDGMLCWVLGTDRSYATAAAYLTLPSLDTIGDTALLSCEVTSTPTPPTSGSTYSAGCPTAVVTGDASATLTLVAQ